MQTFVLLLCRIDIWANNKKQVPVNYSIFITRCLSENELYSVHWETVNTCSQYLISFSLTIEMADCDGGGVKLFNLSRKIYQNIGIFPLEPNQNRRFINLKKWFLVFCHVQMLITPAAYLVLEANSLIECGMIFFNCSSVALSILVYLTMIWQMRSILSFIENCELFIGRSKYHHIGRCMFGSTTETLDLL